MIDARVGLTFASKRPHTTLWLEVSEPEGAPPEELYEALRAIGWDTDGMTVDMFHRSEDGTYRERDVHLIKRGTDLFAGWTDAEKKANMAEVRAVLRKFGFTRVPYWKKTLEDML